MQLALQGRLRVLSVQLLYIVTATIGAHCDQASEAAHAVQLEMKQDFWKKRQEYAKKVGAANSMHFRKVRPANRSTHALIQPLMKSHGLTLTAATSNSAMP